MKRLKGLIAATGILLVAAGGFTLRAADDPVGRDYIKVETSAAGGAKVTILEGTDDAGRESSAKAAGERTNTERVAGETARRVAEAPPNTPPHKARLAVLPAVFSKHFQPEITVSEKIEITGDAELKVIFTTEHESRMEAPSLTLSLAEAFVASRKFDVLERARLKEVIKEIDFGESDYADAAKVVPMGRALNAEYVVLPEVEVIHLVAGAKEVPYVGTVQPRLRGKMILRLRVADTASTRMVAAGSEEVQVERKVKAGNPFLASEINNLVMDLYKAASVRAVHRTLEAIYPVRLLEVTEGKVVLNRGEGAIAVGDEFDVYALGATYKDPDTGEILGQREEKVAVIRVSRVAPKFSEADILEGADRLSGDLQGYLCRETVKSIEAKTRIAHKPIAW